MNLIKLICIIIFYTVSCTGLGSIFLQFKQFRSIEKINKTNLRFLLFSYILGQGIFSFIWLFLALTGLFYSNYIFILTFIPYSMIIFNLPKRIIKIFKEIRFKISILFSLDTGWGVIGLICGLFFLVSLTTFGRPLSADSAQLYMPWAKLIASSHHLTLVPGQLLGSFVGLYSELNYAVFMALGVRDAGRMNDLITVIVCLLTLLLIGSNLNIKKQGVWVIITLLFTSSAFTWLIGKGTPDIYACMLALSSFFLLLPEDDDFNKPSFFLAGFLGGLSFYAKLSYFLGFTPVLISFILIRFFSTHKGFSIKQLWKCNAMVAFLIFGFGVLLGFSPLLIKNAVVFGNSLIAFSGWGNTYFDPDYQKESVTRIYRAFPLSLFYGSFAFQSGRLSPLILAFLPISSLVGFFQKSFRTNLIFQVTISSIFGLIIWMIMRPSIFILRYFLALLLLFSFIPAYSIEHLFQTQKFKIIKILIIGAIAITLLSELSFNVGSFFYPKETLNYLSGSLGECEKDGSRCKALKVINREAAPGDRVLFANHFGYWLRPDLIQCMVSEADNEVYQLTTHGANLPSGYYGYKTRPTFNDLWVQIYEEGFKYIVRYTKPEALAGKLNIEMMENTPWVKLIELYNDGDFEVYRIEYSNPPSKIIKQCVEIEPDLWKVVDVK